MSSFQRTSVVGLTLVLVAWAGVFSFILHPSSFILCWAAPPARPTPEQIEKWVEQLGDNDFTTREEASQKLWEAGRDAEPALQNAASSDDAEVARRARDLLSKFQWGIYPDTPPKIVALVEEYRSAGRGGKGQVIRKLFEAGTPGCRVLAKIATAEQNQEARQELFTQLSVEMPRAVPALLEEDNFEALEALLEVSLAQGAQTGAANYAAYWLLRGKLDQRIAHFKALSTSAPGPTRERETDTGPKRAREDTPQKRNAEILAYLYRARGDLEAARRAAEKADRPDLVEAFLFEAGQWKELARRPEVRMATNAVEKLGLQIAYQRLAGNRKEFEEALDTLREYVEAGGWRPQSFALAKVLFLNDRPKEALDLLQKSDDLRWAQFEILCARMQFRAALGLVEKARQTRGSELPFLEILEARARYVLGEKDRALALFKRYGNQVKEGKDQLWYENLLDAEYRVGLKDLAFEQCARSLAAERDPGWASRLFAKVFPGREETATAFWVVLRPPPLRGPTPSQPEAEAIQRLRALMDGRAARKDVTALIDRVEQARDLKPEERARCWQALADAARARGLWDRARSCLEKADTAESLVRLGDLHAERKEWVEAARCYREAWDKDRTRALPLYLSGWAGVKAGQEKAGKKRMEQAHLLPLGDEMARDKLVREFVRRGLVEAARRENELLLRVSQPASFYQGEAVRRVALEAGARKEYLKAAEGHEQSMLRCLRPYVNFVQPGAYVGVPAYVHRLRAAGLLAAGKVEEGLREVELSRACLPANVDLPILLVPELERLGRKKEAAELFEQTLKEYERLCRESPSCAWAHNSAAWLGACCRRDLDRALEHARRAVELAPDNAGHLDTLAEVYFQRGEKDKAVATQKKAASLDPDRAYYRKQLQRMEAGDPAAPRPAEGDE